MSDFLGLVLAAAAANHPLPEPELNAVSISIPAVDGLRGIGGSYERWIPERRISLSGLGILRQTATGDYGAFSLGVGAEFRWYWRAYKNPWLSKLPNGSMAGWFVGGSVEVAYGATHDRVDDRWIGQHLDTGITALIGYRIAPWRQLAITPTFGIGDRQQFDLTGRLPGYNRPTVSGGLSLGWLF